MGETSQPCARIISTLNVEDEAVRAFYTSLTQNKTVEDYINERQLHFCSRQIEGFFLSHLLALTELILDNSLAVME